LGSRVKNESSTTPSESFFHFLKEFPLGANINKKRFDPEGLVGLHPAPFLPRRAGLVETRRHFFPEELGWLRPGAIFTPKGWAG
jgi:hypothetical protein